MPTNDSIKTIYGFGGMANGTKRQNFVKLYLIYKIIDSEHQQYVEA